MDYGQDDIVCLNNSLRKVWVRKSISIWTTVTIIIDKEETGSCGNNTENESNFFQYFMNNIGEIFGVRQ